MQFLKLKKAYSQMGPTEIILLKLFRSEFQFITYMQTITEYVLKYLLHALSLAKHIKVL
jgi:hypothetical protein